MTDQTANHISALAPDSVPGDNALGHLAMIVGAISIGQTQISGLTQNASVLRAAHALRQLGARVEFRGTTCTIQGRGLGLLREPDQPLDLGNDADLARFMLGLVASQNMTATLFGDQDLTTQSLNDVLVPLRIKGATIMARDGDKLPVTVRGPMDVLATECEFSAQSPMAKLAVLICGLNARGATTIIEPAIQDAAARSFDDSTVKLLQRFGVSVRQDMDESGRARTTILGQRTLFGARVALGAVA